MYGSWLSEKATFSDPVLTANPAGSAPQTAPTTRGRATPAAFRKAIHGVAFPASNRATFRQNAVHALPGAAVSEVAILQNEPKDMRSQAA
jgi:hypothetical protein